MQILHVYTTGVTQASQLLEMATAGTDLLSITMAGNRGYQNHRKSGP